MQMLPKQVGKVLAISDRSAAGVVGTAAATVDGAKILNIAQATSGMALTLPNPTDLNDLVALDVVNTGSVSFTMYGVVVPAKSFATFLWTGSSWAAPIFTTPAFVPGYATGAPTSMFSNGGGTSYADTGFSVSITTASPSSNVRFYFRGYVGTVSNNTEVMYAGAIDGGTEQFCTFQGSNAAAATQVIGECLFTNVAAGTHTIKLRYKNYASNGAGTMGGNANYPMNLIAEEIPLGAGSIPAMTGATSSAAGATGGAPAPAAGQQDAHLAGDGTWDQTGRMTLVTLSGFSGTQTPSASSTVDIAEILELSPSGNGTIVSLPGPTSRKSRRLIVVNTSGNSLTLQQVLTNGNMNNNSWTLAAYTAIVAIWTPGLNNWMRVN